MNEVKDYTYRFTVGSDGGIFECDRCGALVPLDRIKDHNHFHVTINVLASASGGVA
jgi:hypothetical protein